MLIWVPPVTGKLYYLLMMLTHVRGLQSYEEIKIVNNVNYNSFRDACIFVGFIGDDKEFIAAITDENHWGSSLFLILFVHMLLSSIMNRPSYVWSKTQHLLSNSILYAQQTLARIRGINLTISLCMCLYTYYGNYIHNTILFILQD